MFSKAPVKRFNEEVGCAPPPTAYNPKSLDKLNAVSIDKSDRWKENKENTPAPNAYNSGLPAPLRTPGRGSLPHRPKPLRPLNRSGSTGPLDTSAASNTSTVSTSSAKKDSAFTSPLAPRLARSGSCRSIRNNTEKYVAQLQQLQQERDTLQQTVIALEDKLSSLQCHLAEGLAAHLEKEVQTDQSLLCSHDSRCSAADVSSYLASMTLQDEMDSPDARVDIIQQSPAPAAATITASPVPADRTDDSKAICESTGEAVSAEEENNEIIPKDTTSTIRSSEDDLELLREQIAHLTRLRDNLESSVARKDQMIGQLQEECSLLVEEGRLHDHLVETCRLQLEELESRLSESMLEVCNVPEESMPGVEGLVRRVAGLVFRFEALLRDHSEHCSLQLATLNTTVATLGAKVNSYELEVSTLRAVAGERTAKVTALEETISELSIATKEKEMMEAMMQEEIRQRNRELSLLEEGYTSLEQKVSEAEQRAAVLAAERQKRVDVERRLEELTVAVREAEVLQHFLQKEVLSREEEVTSEKMRVQSLSEELSTARKVALDLQGEAEAQLNQVLVLKAALAAKDYDIDERDENIIALKEEIESKQELATDLQDMLSTQKAAKAQLTQELEHNKVKVSELEDKVSNACSDVTRLAERLEQVQREHDVGLSCLKDMHRAELEGAREDREAMAVRVASLKEECEAGERDLEQLKEKLAESRATVTTLEAKMVELMAELEDREIAHEKRVEEVRAELEELSAQYSESLLEAEATKRALSHSALQQQQVLAATEADLRQVREELSSVQSNLSTKIEEYSTLEYSLRQLSDKFTSLEKVKADDAEQHELCRRLRAELQLSQQDGEELRTDMKMVVSSNEGFKTQILQLRQDLTKKAAALEECKQCVEQLRDERNLATTCTQQLQLQLEDRDDQMQDLHQQLQEARRSVEKSQDALASAKAGLERETLTLRRQIEEVRAEQECAREEAVRREREQSQQETSQLQRRVDQLEQYLQDVAELKDEFAHKVITLENAAEEQFAESERCKEEHKLLLSMHEQHAQLEKELKASVSTLEETQAELVQCRSELQLRDGRLAKQEEELAHRTVSLVANEQALTATTARLIKLEEHSSQLQETLNTCQEEKQQALGEVQNLSEERHSLVEREVALMRARFEDSLNEALQQRQEAEAEANRWKEQCAILEKLVEPFRGQLESYEAERATLLCTQSAAQKEVSELSLKYASLLGHHNHKQKIHHVTKLKTENNRLIEEVAKLRVESDRYRKTVRRLEERLESRTTDLPRRKTLAGAASYTEAEGKENIGGLSRSPLRPSNKFNRL